MTTGLGQSLKDEVWDIFDEEFKKQGLSLWKNLVEATEQTAFETGALRSSWTAQFNEPDDSEIERPDPPEPNSVPPPSPPSLEGSLRNGETVIWISNFKDYARWVNDGDHNGTPADFLDLGIENWKSESIE